MTEYANGFKDGFAAGLEEGKKMNDKTYTDGLIEGMKKTMPPPYVPKETCPKCGINLGGVMGYVCSSINCPTFYTATSSVGAVGSFGDPNADRWTQGYNGGENGPVGPIFHHTV